MMKSFFKKLAFVMALAMVVSMAAPAGSALAAGLSVAYQAGGAVSELNLKAGAEQDLKFLGAPKNWKDLGWSWTSSNEAVATVDAAGIVTAVADGTATITITVGDLTGSVVVNVGDAKAYDVTLGNADNKAMTTAELKKGANLDLNFYGVKDWNKNNYTVAWSVSGDAANVDKNGVVTAVKAGKAVVTASIVNNVTGVAHNVAPVEVTVAAEVNADAFTVAQKDTDKFVLTFNEAKTVDAIKEGLTVSVKIGDKDYPISFENVAVDGNKVTVVTYARFENDEVYTLAFGKEKVDHTIVLGDIASVGADYYTGKNKDNKVAYVTEEEENDYVTLVPVLYDEYGNNITAKYNLNNFSFSYEVSSNVAPMCVYNDTYAFDNAGLATVKVTAAWVTDAGEYKEAFGSSNFQVLKRGTIGLTLNKAAIADTGWKDDDIFTYINDAKKSFQVDPNSAKWGGAGTSIAYKTNDTRELIYTAVFTDNRGNVITTNDPVGDNVYKFGTFTYESTNSEVLTVADNTGEVVINKVGKANVLVYFTPADGTGNKKLVASTAITVTPEPYPVSYKMTTAFSTQPAHVVDEGLNNATFKVQFYDQFGKVYRNDELISYMKIDARDINNEVKPSTPSWESWSGNYVFSIDGSAFADELTAYNLTGKTYSYKFYLEDGDLTSTIKTPYAVCSITAKNTLEEKNIISAFIAETKGGTADGVTGNADVPSNYKFNISFGGSQNVDVAVKNVIGYGDTNAQQVIKSAWNTEIGATYMSSGNLPIASVPKYLLKDNAALKATTGHAGYVYYKVNTPSNTTVAGTSVKNTFYTVAADKGKIAFAFNKFVDHPTLTETREWLEDADGNQYILQLRNVEDEKWPFYADVVCVTNTVWGKQPIFAPDGGTVRGFDKLSGDVTYKLNDPNQTEVTYKKAVVPVQEFRYAGTGNYSVSFSTTRKEGSTLYNVASRSINITNSQNQVKYVGLNPEFEGVTELTISKDNLAAIVNEQLMLSFDEIFLGEAYGSANAWGMKGVTIEIDAENSKVHPANDGKSMTITSLAIKVTLDDANADTDYTYTSVVSVGARIKAK